MSDPCHPALGRTAATFANMRFGELAGLRRGQLDLEACAVRVAMSTAELGDGRLIDDDPKPAAGRRTVAFPHEIAPELKWHLECFAQAGDMGKLFHDAKKGTGPTRSGTQRARGRKHAS